MVKIITDSSTLYSPEEGKKLGFDVMPLCVSIADLEDRDLLVDMDVFYGKIAEGNHPRSSQPPVGEVMEIYESYPEDDIINIAMADGLSGTYQSACGARESVDHKDKIVVFNSKTLCGPHRYMVEKAQKMAEEGKSAKEILTWLEYASAHHESFLIPQETGIAIRAFEMKQTDDGKRLDKFGVKRTMKAVVAAIIDHLKKAELDSRHVLYVSHARVPEDAKKVVAQLQEAFPEVEYHILDLGAAFVTQGGPGCIAIQYIQK